MVRPPAWQRKNQPRRWHGFRRAGEPCAVLAEGRAMESTVWRGGVVSLTKPDGRAFRPSEGKSGRNDSGQCGQAGGAGANELTDVCSRPRMRALNFNELVRVAKARCSKALAFVFAVGTVQERRLSGASGVTERPNVIYTST